MSSPASLPKEITRSAERGELQKVVKWLRKGGETDAICPASTADGHATTVTLLLAASGSGHLQMVKELLKRGASVNLPNSLGCTALMGAALNGHLSIVLVLLQHSAGIDLQDRIGRTALMVTAYQGQEACVKALLRAKANIELLDKDGFAALQHAEDQGHTAIAQLLRQHAAPPQPAAAAPAAPPDACGEPAVSKSAASMAALAEEAARLADDRLLEAVRGLHLAHPELGPKPLLAKLRQQQPDLAAGNKEVREALAALKAEESKPTEAAAAAPPAAAQAPAAATPPVVEEGGAPPNVEISLACFGCGRLPSEMGDGREKHPVCPICRELKIPTTYWCDVNCPGNPGAWKRHKPAHKEVRRQRQFSEDGGVAQQRNREVAEETARYAAQSGDAYAELVAEGTRYISQENTRRAARAYREAIALSPDRPEAYFNLGCALNNSAHYVEAAQRFLEARERFPVGSEDWAQATALAFAMLTQDVCAEVAKPEWWSDEGLKALSARVVRAAPDDAEANRMRAIVLCRQSSTWVVGPRSAAELREAAAHYERAAALHPAPSAKAEFADFAAACRRCAEAM